MRLKYTGPFDAVIVPEVRDEPIENGEIIDVDDATGKRLELSADWTVTSRKKGDDA